MVERYQSFDLRGAAARGARTILLAAALSLASTLTALSGTHLDLATPGFPSMAGSNAGDRLGYSLGAGGMGPKGQPMLAAGAPGFDAGADRHDCGAVMVFDATLLPSLPREASADSLAAVLLTGSQPDERFGGSIVVADLDGDRVADLAVGAPGWGAGPLLSAGRLYVFLGPLEPSGEPLSAEEADVVLRGSRAGDLLGTSLASGDTNADGIPELIVSAPRARNGDGERSGIVYAVRADSLAARLPREPGDDGLDVARVCEWRIEGIDDGDALRGAAVVPGFANAPPSIAVGAYHADGRSEREIDSGKVYVLRGDAPTETSAANDTVHTSLSRSASGACRPLSLSGQDVLTIVGPHPRSLLGRSLASGDVDGDGFSDLAMSAYASRGKRKKADASGEVYLLYGDEALPSGTLELSDSELPRFHSDRRWDLFGLPVMVCDMNGDDRCELIVSAQFADLEDDGRTRCGQVYVFWGGPRSVIDVKTGDAEVADVTLSGPGSGYSIGGALAAVKATGGYPDLAIGAPDAPGGPGLEAAGMVILVPSDALLSR